MEIAGYGFLAGGEPFPKGGIFREGKRARRRSRSVKGDSTSGERVCEKKRWGSERRGRRASRLQEVSAHPYLGGYMKTYCLPVKPYLCYSLLPFP